MKNILFSDWEYVGGDGSSINAVTRDLPSDSRWDDNEVSGGQQIELHQLKKMINPHITFLLKYTV